MLKEIDRNETKSKGSPKMKRRKSMEINNSSSIQILHTNRLLQTKNKKNKRKWTISLWIINYNGKLPFYNIFWFSFGLLWWLWFRTWWWNPHLRICLIHIFNDTWWIWLHDGRLVIMHHSCNDLGVIVIGFYNFTTLFQFIQLVIIKLICCNCEKT